MKTKILPKAFLSLCVIFGLAITVFLALAAIPALATFPGENGRIAFARRDPNIGDLDIYTANSDGSDVQQLTFVPSFESDWRADGKRIAFDFVDSDGNVQIATRQSRRVKSTTDHFWARHPRGAVLVSGRTTHRIRLFASLA